MVYRRAYVPAALLRRMRRAKAEDRPECPSCGQRSPPQTDLDYGAGWFQTWGHRCPHGEPCPSFGTLEGERHEPTCRHVSCTSKAASVVLEIPEGDD